ncbi:MAG: hypothetical protein KC442_18680, partial [Thermomicrobiales bacterium]|nr:hypothetical protein [Thermomicrobiales bacterium]
QSSTSPSPDVGQQQESAPALSLLTFLVVIPLLAEAPGALPRVSQETRRLHGREPRVLAPPPRLAAAGV